MFSATQDGAVISMYRITFLPVFPLKVTTALPSLFPVMINCSVPFSPVFPFSDNFIFLYHLDSIGQQNKVVYFTNSDYKKEFAIEYEHIISTIPLGVLCKAMLIDTPELNSNPIYVSNYKVNGIVPNWLINLYVPSLRYPMYRASLLNGVCSVESIRPLTEVELNVVVKDTLSMFHIVELIEKYT